MAKGTEEEDDDDGGAAGAGTGVAMDGWMGGRVDGMVGGHKTVGVKADYTRMRMRMYVSLSIREE
jgi:hypothetical protein